MQIKYAYALPHEPHTVKKGMAITGKSIHEVMNMVAAAREADGMITFVDAFGYHTGFPARYLFDLVMMPKES